MSLHFEKKAFSLIKQLKSFTFAFAGLKEFFATQQNAKIHLTATIIVVAAGLWLKITHFEWLAIVFAIALVFVAEIFNTAIEYLVDFVSPNYHSKAGKIKDLAAGATLAAAIFAAVIGLIVFIPYFNLT